jgi:chemotaxis methyl-accepting protein methylase
VREAELDVPAEDLEAILGHVAREKGLDLRDYRRPTLARRVRARMEALGDPDAATYRRRTESDRRELDRLAEALLVRFTSFFRDPAVFDALARSVLPRLVREAAARDAPVRAWVVGAASGEEAYSVAMVLADLCREAGRPFQVLGTDRSEQAVELARRGLYHEDELAPLPERLRELFAPSDGAFVVRDSLKAQVRFARHDLMAPRLSPPEAVLASFDVVLCRNVLIYLDERYRARAFERLATVVQEGGALVLGSSEALPLGMAERFAPFPGTDASSRIFRKRPKGEETAA